MYSKCPIPITHRRLEHAHRLWHQALRSYDDAEGFHTNLNALIEALRSVTFMLQSEKSEIPNFDSWYEGWQQSMKGDTVMAWLRDARTTVVHKGDLVTASTALATVHTNLSLATAAVVVPSAIPTTIVCEMLANSLPEPFSSQPEYLVLSVERRWCVAELPDRELLDALAHAYELLIKIVREAHERSGQRLEDELQDTTHSSGLEGRPTCMIVTTEARTVRISLADRRVLSPSLTVEPVSLEEAEVASRRYGFKERVAPPEDPFAFAERLVMIAKGVLKKDKNHVRLVWLKTPSGWTLQGMQAQDRVEKYVLMRRLAEEIQRVGATALVEISEMWVSSVEEYRAGRMPENARDRGEALVVSAAKSDGAFRTYRTPFSRSILGNIRFEETTVFDESFPTYMTPVCEAWGLPIPAAVEPGETGQ